jgi:hypothetical protein
LPARLPSQPGRPRCETTSRGASHRGTGNSPRTASGIGATASAPRIATCRR